MKEETAFLIERIAYFQDGSKKIRKADLLFDIYGELIYALAISRKNPEVIRKLIYIGSSVYLSSLKEHNQTIFDYIE